MSIRRDDHTRSIDDLFDALTGAGVLANFHRLPLRDQGRFIRWIEEARDAEGHWRRIDILVHSMVMSPQMKPIAEAPPASPGFAT